MPSDDWNPGKMREKFTRIYKKSEDELPSLITRGKESPFLRKCAAESQAQAIIYRDLSQIDCLSSPKALKKELFELKQKPDDDIEDGIDPEAFRKAWKRVIKRVKQEYCP